MITLVLIAAIYGLLFLFYGSRNFKGFLLLTGIVTLPFPVDYSLISYTTRGVGLQGWTGGIFIKLSDISFLLLYCRMLLRKQERNAPSRIIIPILCFVGTCTLSIINSTWIKMSLFEIVLIAQTAFLYYYVLFNSIESEADLHLVVLSLMLALVFQGVIANLQYWTGSEIDITVSTSEKVFKQFEVLSYGTAELRRAMGTVMSPNGFAGYITPLLLLSLSVFSLARKYRTICFLGLLLGIPALMLSFSRGGWLSFTISVTLLLTVMIKRKITRPIILVGVALVIFMIISFVPGINKRIFEDDKNAAMSRIPLNQIAFNMIKEHPIIGIGANTFRSVIHSYTYNLNLPWVYLDVVHNMYLLVFAECGFLGIVVFLWLLLTFFRESWQCSKNSENRFIQALGLGITAGLFGFCLHNMVERLYASHLGLSMMFVMCSLCSAAREISLMDRPLSTKN